MNALIFKDEEESKFLPHAHPKAEHIRQVLKMSTGDEIFAGVLNCNMFKTKILEAPLGYKFCAQTILPNPPLKNVILCAAFSRPQIAKRILFEAACFGVKELIFYIAQKGEEGYLKSSLYETYEYLEHLIKGAEQACSTLIPNFKKASSLVEALELIESPALKIAPDPYEAEMTFKEALDSSSDKGQTRVIILGGERGYCAADRIILRQKGALLVSLGERILRTDSAAITSLALAVNF